MSPCYKGVLNEPSGVLRDVANNAYTKEPVELSHRSELIPVEELVFEFLVDVQLG
jgi:hypothetical protein